MRIVRRVRADVGVLALVLAAAGCVEAFDGSNVQIDFNSGVQTNTRPGDTPQPDQPPANTHYVLYGADLVYQRDANNRPVLDVAGQPVILRSFLFEVQRFEIRSAIDRTSPCFIDLERTRFPGIHVTQYAAAVRAATGITDPFLPGQDPDDVTDVLTADRRASNLPLIESALKAVTSYADFRYPAIGTQCANEAGVDRMLIPPATCADPESNDRKLKSGCRCTAMIAVEPAGGCTVRVNFIKAMAVATAAAMAAQWSPSTATAARPTAAEIT